MFSNLRVNLFTRKKNSKQTKASLKLFVTTKRSPAIRDFFRGERQVLRVEIKLNDNQ